MSDATTLSNAATNVLSRITVMADDIMSGDKADKINQKRQRRFYGPLIKLNREHYPAGLQREYLLRLDELNRARATLAALESQVRKMAHDLRVLHRVANEIGTELVGGADGWDHIEGLRFARRDSDAALARRRAWRKAKAEREGPA